MNNETRRFMAVGAAWLLRLSGWFCVWLVLPLLVALGKRPTPRSTGRAAVGQDPGNPAARASARDGRVGDV